MSRLLRTKRLFLAASELPEAQWLAFLKSEEADVEIRDRVLRQLRRLKDEPDEVRGQTTAATPRSDPESIDRYRIVRRLGEGGMGIVYLAEQTEPVHRTVALKRIRHGMDTERVLRRFDAEREALAALDHPCIARVYDAGSDDEGRPFVAMEYVDGQPLTDYCNQHGLDTEQRLALFVDVCRGVQHAHQRGVLHRDLKPSNVIVTEIDGRPVPKIIDFGLAKAVRANRDESLRTQIGMLIGTPEYMSPEQADPQGNDVDTRADVYSLGVMLYELLSGLLPFDPDYLRQQGLLGVQQVLRNEEPPKPSSRVSTASESNQNAADTRRVAPHTLVARLRGDLDWIALRALEKDRERRYASPDELAADLERHLRHEPVEAGPPTARYRLQKYLRRHRLQIGVAAAVIGSLVVGLVLALSFALEARSQFRAAERAREEADESARVARDEKRAAEDARRESEQARDYVTSMLGFFDPDQTQTSQVDIEALLIRAAAEAENRFAEQPSLLATILNQIGNASWTRGLMLPAESQLRRAYELRVADSTTTPQEYHAVLVPLAWVTWYTGSLKNVWRRSLVSAREYACTAVPELDRPIRDVLSWGQGHGLYCDLEQGRTEILRLVADLPDGDPRWVAIGDLMLAIGDYAQLRGNFEFSARCLRDADEMFSRRARLAPTHTRRALLREIQLQRRYKQAADRGDFAASAAAARQAHDELRKVVPHGHYYLAMCRSWEALMLRKAGSPSDDVLALLEPAVTELVESLGFRAESVRIPLIELVRVLQERGDSADRWRTRLLENARTYHVRMMDLPDLLLALGDLPEEFADRLSALEKLRRKDPGPDASDPALPILERVFDDLDALYPNKGMAHDVLLGWLGEWTYDRRIANSFQYIQNREFARRTTRYVADRIDPEAREFHRDIYRWASDLANDPEEGLRFAQRSLTAALATGASELNELISRNGVAGAQRRAGNWREAVEIWSRTYRRAVREAGAYGWQATNAAHGLRTHLYLNGRHEQAAEVSRTHLQELLKGGAMPDQLNRHAWALARLTGLDEDAYRLALRAADEALRRLRYRMRTEGADDMLRRSETGTCNTRGVLLVRLNEDALAVAALEESIELRKSLGLDAFAADHAFLALCKQRLGRDGEARTSLRAFHAHEGNERSPQQELEYRSFQGELEKVFGDASSWNR